MCLTNIIFFSLSTKYFSLYYSRIHNHLSLILSKLTNKVLFIKKCNINTPTKPYENIYTVYWLLCYFLTRFAILCKWGLTVLFKADSGEDGAGDGGVVLLLSFVEAKFCSFRTCSLAPLKQMDLCISF